MIYFYSTYIDVDLEHYELFRDKVRNGKNSKYVFDFDINALQHTACLVVHPITVGNFASS